MRRYLLDTGIVGDYLHRRRGVYQRAREESAKGNRIGIAVSVLMELWYGVEMSATRDRNEEILKRGLSDFTVWPLDREAAEEFGRLRAALARMGRPMQVPDIMIAAVALSLGKTTVVSSDSDLRAVPGLDVEDWMPG
ncbi:MAG: type II toxin-antitoxin system VapC family toxin [Gemmataceae bacterium]|nr:type II toxin-antitoxin system VapC family toxin [Gemmataceae bacterium]